MYKITFSMKVHNKISNFINSYKTIFLERFCDTWILDENLIINSYIKFSEEFKERIISEIEIKLSKDLVLWRLISEKEIISVFIFVWNYKILLSYRERNDDKIRIIQEIEFYKK